MLFKAGDLVMIKFGASHLWGPITRFKNELMLVIDPDTTPTSNSLEEPWRTWMRQDPGDPEVTWVRFLVSGSCEVLPASMFDRVQYLSS